MSYLSGPGIYVCPECGCPLQRTTTGDLTAGVAAHNAAVHPRRKEIS